MVVCGNKVDLETSRVISTQQGREFAKKIGAPFFETSAKTRLNVEEAFNELVREMRRWQKRHPEHEQHKKPNKGGKCVIL